MTLPTPSTYTPDQLRTYSDLVSLPKRYHYASLPTPSYELLNALHVHQITSIPYENLSLHYTASPTRGPPSLDPAVLWEKIVGCNDGKGHGRGGYCVELTVFFKNVLRGFGFDVYTAGARIRLREGGVPMGDYIGWVHCVNIVTLPTGAKYVLDISFGGDGPTLPMPLTPGVVHANMGTQEIRLMRDYLPGQVLRRAASASDAEDDNDPNKPWIYQYRNSADAPWNSFYAFYTAIEFLDPDLAITNAAVASPGFAASSFQTRAILAVKFVRAPAAVDDNDAAAAAAEPRVAGKLMLAGADVKLNEGTGAGSGRTRVVQRCASEAERVGALREWFGIELAAEQLAGIRGWQTELKG